MAKRLLSKRDISVDLFLLDNGNGLLEGVLLDTGHLIRLEMEINPKTRLIVAADCRLVTGPFALCKFVSNLATGLIGLKIEKGVMKKVGQAVGGKFGCVHLKELVIDTINFAATAMVGIESGFGLMDPGFARKDPETRHLLTENLLLDTCYCYSHKYKDHKKLYEE